MSRDSVATRHVVWDWNGTLLDDRALCVSIMNGMLARRGLPAIDEPFYRAVMDFPVEQYYRKLGFDFSQGGFEPISDEFVAAYQAGWRNCRLYDGALAMMDALRVAGIGQSVLSASKATHLEEQLAFFDVDGRLDAVSGVSDHHGRGKLHMAQVHVDGLGVSAQSVLFVGDSLHDAEVARAAGARCILVGFGHFDPARLKTTGLPVVGSVGELQRLLLSQAN